MKRIAVLGSTGSIGTQTLDVIKSAPNDFEVTALAVGSMRSAPLLFEQIKRFEPKYVAMTDESEAEALKAELIRLGSHAKLILGEDSAAHAAALPENDIVVNGISGFSGMKPLIFALDAGIPTALANKESVVCAHKLVKLAEKRAWEKNGQRLILPVDSEQSAIFQCLAAGRREDVKRVLLTASGGPFLRYSKDELARVTPQQAGKHPTWNMGAKITIDSATLFNKGLEIMETSYLFDISGDKIDVVIHPQSVVHSMVEFMDNSVLAQLSAPDMRLAIKYALTYPKRQSSDFGALSLERMSTLTFEAPDTDRFPAIKLAYEALNENEALPIAFNAANETAVESFRAGKAGFLDIAPTVEKTMDKVRSLGFTIGSVDDIILIDAESRRIAAALLA